MCALILLHMYMYFIPVTHMNLGHLLLTWFNFDPSMDK